MALPPASELGLSMQKSQKIITVDARPFSGLDHFIFDGPLYAKYSADDAAIPLFCSPGFADGHCIYCNQNSTFHREQNARRVDSMVDIPISTFTSKWICARSQSHTITMFVLRSQSYIMKIGQLPSLADIAHDASREYRQVLKGADRNELSKAIGLAAHGVGVGSFVYMRRVFERLIESRRATSGVTEEDFAGKRMLEKIDLLKEYLPEFLVANKSIYGILSRGIHELTEEECLAFYPIMYESIITILEDDKLRIEKEERKKRLSAAISQFSKPVGRDGG